MNKRFSYTIPQMTRRLLRIAAPVKGLLIISTLASILGNLAQIGLMSSGALLLLTSQKLIPANPALCAAAMAGCAVVIVAGRYTEGVISHAGAYRLLADMRIQLYRTLRPWLRPASLTVKRVIFSASLYRILKPLNSSLPIPSGHCSPSSSCPV